MTLKELQKTDWYQARPKVIQDAINLLPPNDLLKFNDSGKQCSIYSYEEPDSGKLEDVTVTVQKTGKGGVLDDLGLGEVDKHGVFGVPLSDLEKW